MTKQYQGIQQVNKIVYRQGQRQLVADHVIVEQPLQIRLLWLAAKGDAQSHIFTITMRTPGDDKALVVGLLLSEGIITKLSDIKTIEIELKREDETPTTDMQNQIEVTLADNLTPNLVSLERYQTTYSSCGLCGTTSLSTLELKNPPILSQKKQWLDITKIYSLSQTMKKSQQTYSQTGGAHGAAVFNALGELLIMAEDIGRHNALDKLLGNLLISNTHQTEAAIHSELVVFISSRISFEIVQKTVMSGISVLIAVGAPSDLAIKAAKRFNLTLIGFVTEQSFNIYHGDWRLK